MKKLIGGMERVEEDTVGIYGVEDHHCENPR